MTSLCLPSFWDLLNGLPTDVQAKAQRSYRLWLEDPGHNSLDFKKIKNSESTWQTRPAYGYRALCDREGDECTWFWIGTKAEAMKLI